MVSDLPEPAACWTRQRLVFVATILLMASSWWDHGVMLAAARSSSSAALAPAVLPAASILGVALLLEAVASGLVHDCRQRCDNRVMNADNDFWLRTDHFLASADQSNKTGSCESALKSLRTARNRPREVSAKWRTERTRPWA